MKLKILHREDLRSKVAVIVGTRPGIVKFAPVIKELQRRDADYVLIHTGQHYSPNMDRAFFEALELPEPAHTNPKVATCQLHGEQTAEMIVGIEKALIEERPAVVVVGGDANTNLAGALATRKLVSITLAHMEAGLRSGDWSMPEEHNRVIIDHISEVLFAPTETCRENLRADSVRGRIVLTGNTIVDAVQDHLGLAEEKSDIIERLRLEHQNYVIVTIHREENVDNPEVVARLLANLRAMAAEQNTTLVFPIHPRTRLRFEQFGVADQLDRIVGLKVIEPIDYLDMLRLLANSEMVLTDSGGIQEEACVLHVPCITLRHNTERPETVEVGSNRVVGSDQNALLDAVRYFRTNGIRDWSNPYGDGHAASRIVDELVAVADSAVTGMTS